MLAVGTAERLGVGWAEALDATGNHGDPRGVPALAELGNPFLG